ncbi:hypothetical protein K1719_036434 [Acacia pycnantha]|nr:hypothetical protein K1719_036434 [Acacia pycnantha]
MIATLPNRLFSPTRTILCSSKAKKQRKQWRNQENKSTLSFPKTRPTPLLINHEPYTQTKSQALEEIVRDLESSVDKGIKIDAEIYASLLETCYHLQATDHGIRVHRLIPSSLCVETLASHRSCLGWYAEVGLYDDAMALYFQMVEDGVQPDLFTFPRVLKACGGIGSIQVGEELHRHVVRFGFLNDRFVLNALVDMYAKCGDIVKARKVFDKMPHRDSVSWNSMLTAYIHHGLEVEAVNTFKQILLEGHGPDSVAISTILTGVLSLGAGVQVHGWVIRQGIEWNLSVANSLIIMYSSHGKLNRARWIFDHMPERDVVSWNSVISAHCKHKEALTYFMQMEEAGARPDKITFVSILSACAHLSLVKEGKRLFSLMNEKYRIKPIMEHYGCMVNLYGRAGLIEEAYRFIVDRMELEAGPTVWGALLYACSVHGNVTIGEVAANKLFDLEPDNEHNFELLMKIYENAGRSEDMERIRMMMVDRGLDH